MLLWKLPKARVGGSKEKRQQDRQEEETRALAHTHSASRVGEALEGGGTPMQKELLSDTSQA